MIDTLTDTATDTSFFEGSLGCLDAITSLPRVGGALNRWSIPALPRDRWPMSSGPATCGDDLADVGDLAIVAVGGEPVTIRRSEWSASWLQAVKYFVDALLVPIQLSHVHIDDGAHRATEYYSRLMRSFEDNIALALEPDDADDPGELRPTAAAVLACRRLADAIARAAVLNTAIVQTLEICICDAGAGRCAVLLDNRAAGKRLEYRVDADAAHTQIIRVDRGGHVTRVRKGTDSISVAEGLGWLP